MTTFVIVLLVLYLLFWGAPRLLVWWVRRRSAKFHQQMDEAIRRNQRQSHEAESPSRRGHGHLDEMVSEEAEYVDIVGTREEVVQENYVVEEQVVDAEFEEI